MCDTTAFEDVRVIDGHLVAAIVGPGVSRIAPKKNYCTAVFCDIDYGWLASDGLEDLPFEYRDEGSTVHWPDVDRSISVDEVLRRDAGGMIYHIRWKLNKIRSDVCVDDAIGCWKTVAGYTMLDGDGTARVKLVGRGTSGDLVGDWRWEQIERSVFRLFQATPGAPLSAMESTFALSRFDGKTLELHQSTQFEDGRRLDTVVLWSKAKPPKSWQDPRSNE